LSSTGKKKTKTKTQRKTAAKARPPKRTQPPKKAQPSPTALPSPTPTPKKEVAVQKSYLLAIRLKGTFATPWPIQKSLETLRLQRKFNAVLVENNPAVIGMLRAVKDYVTWAEAKQGDIATLLRERGELTGGGQITDKITKEKFGEDSIQELASALTQGRLSLHALWQKGLNPVFRLHPPSGGFERSAKRPYGSGGELGRRLEGISGLLTQMA
jgi:large subunit ribosomal protein L30